MKWTFTQLEHACGLLKAVLPPALSALTDWSTLRIEKSSFVDRALRSRHSDLLFSVKVDGREALFYVLMEHQSTVEPLMVFRFGLYMWRHWEQLVRDHPDRTTLPPIIPLLLHHSEHGWTAATAFEQVVETSEASRAAFEKYVPRFSLRVVDLSEGSARDLADAWLTGFGKFVLWCLSVANDDERFEAELPRMKEVLTAAVLAANGHEALEVLMRYLVATHVRLKARRIGRLLSEATGTGARKKIMDFVDRKFRQEAREEGHKEGREEGRAEGRAVGRAEGRAEALLELLAARFGKVTAAARSRVRAARENELTAWTLRVLTAATLDEVLAAAPVAPQPKPRRSSRRAASSPARRPR